MSAKATLRLASAADAPAIRDLTRQAYAQWVPVIGREPLPMTADYEAALRDHRFDLLEEGGVLVALVETILKPDHLWIENLAVHPSHRGRGLGRRMLDETTRIAHLLDRREIRLVTNGAFTSNLAFYARNGFVLDREEAFRGGRAVFFRKAL